VGKMSKGQNYKRSQKKLVKEALQMLRERSKKSIKLAQNELLTINIKSLRGRQALEHYARNWDDVVHPGILSMACEATGGKTTDVTQMQVILLLLTAAMDVFDDIIDETTVKNGKSTIFGVFGKDISLLIGNAMFMKGFFLLSRYCKALPPEVSSSVVDAIQSTFFELGDAHLLETEIKRKLDITPSEYMPIIKKKGSNIEAMTRVGAIIGKASRKQLDILGEYGRILGTLITLREEFIDIFEPDELINRFNNKFLPLPMVYAFQDSQAKEDILKTLSGKKLSPRAANKIADVVFESKGVAKLKAYMKTLSRDALTLLYELPQKYLIPKLELIVDSTLEDL
jgi:geranylgeranyl pyrophosphate synthase